MEHSFPARPSCPECQAARRCCAVLQPSQIRWASRWDTYLMMMDDQIHWFSIINSLMIVLFLSGAPAACPSCNCALCSYSVLMMVLFLRLGCVCVCVGGGGLCPALLSNPLPFCQLVLIIMFVMPVLSGVCCCTAAQCKPFQLVMPALPRSAC
jgi:hypothetical protein